jgi:hypothetical protein
MMSHGSTTLSSQPAILIKVVGEPETALDVSPGPQAGGGVYSKTTELLDAASGGKHLMRAAAISRCSVIAGLQVYLSICNDWDDLSYLASEPPHHPPHFMASRMYAPSQRKTVGPPFHQRGAQRPI